MTIFKCKSIHLLLLVVFLERLYLMDIARWRITPPPPPPPRLSMIFFAEGYYPCLHCLNSVYYSNCLNSSMYADIYCQGRLKHNWTGQLSCWAKTWGDWSGWWVLPLLTTRAPTVLQNIKVGKVKVLGKLPKIFTCAAMCQSSVMPILRLSKKLSQFSSRTSAFPIAPSPGYFLVIFSCQSSSIPTSLIHSFIN